MPNDNNTGTKNTSINNVNTHSPRNLSDAAYDEAMETAEGVEGNETLKDHKPNAKLGTDDNKIRGEESGNETLEQPTSPNVKGEQAISGDMPDPSTDDDTLRAEHQVGLRQNETEENREELDIASDRDKAEIHHKEH